MIRRIWKRLTSLVAPKKHLNLTDYWHDRARQYGKRSVLNLAHSEEEFDKVTDYQKQFLFPLLKFELNGTESSILDFGCGPGRFTLGLAELINGPATGVDISPELLEHAPKSSSVSYQSIGAGSALPFCDSSFDVVWSCLVLGTIPDSQIEQSIAEIERVLRPGGLFFYVENTANNANLPYFTFRDVDTYIRLAAFCQPKVLDCYLDMEEQITIFAGRK